MGSTTNYTQPFALFTCPRCGHYQRHAKLLVKGWRSYHWCGECRSYFRLKHGTAIGLAWGITIAAIASGFLWAAVSYSNGRWDFLWLIITAQVLALPVMAAVWPLFVRQLFRYEYVGRDAL